MSKVTPRGADVALGLLIVGLGVLAVALTGWFPAGIVCVIIAALLLAFRTGAVGLRLAPSPGLWRALGWGFAGFIATHLVLATTGPLVLRFFSPPDQSVFRSLRGNPVALVGWICVAWTSGAFGEEIVFRGALQGWLRARFGGALGTTTAVALTSILFGAAHSYQGAAGMVLTGLAGAVYGIVGIRCRDSLWPSVIAHGLYDTSAFVFVFLSR